MEYLLVLDREHRILVPAPTAGDDAFKGPRAKRVAEEELGIDRLDYLGQAPDTGRDRDAGIHVLLRPESADDRDWSGPYAWHPIYELSGLTVNTPVRDLLDAYYGVVLKGFCPPADRFTVWSFGNSEALADELADLVLKGRKTGTSSLLWAYEAEGADLPRKGDLSVITRWNGQPVAVIETVEVTVRPFAEVDAQHARSEGEGDLSLAFWRDVHWTVYSSECAALGKTPSPAMPVVCERLRVVKRLS